MEQDAVRTCLSHAQWKAGVSMSTLCEESPNTPTFLIVCKTGSTTDTRIWTCVSSNSSNSIHWARHFVLLCQPWSVTDDWKRISDVNVCVYFLKIASIIVKIKIHMHYQERILNAWWFFSDHQTSCLISYSLRKAVFHVLLSQAAVLNADWAGHALTRTNKTNEKKKRLFFSWWLLSHKTLQRTLLVAFYR